MKKKVLFLAHDILWLAGGIALFFVWRLAINWQVNEMYVTPGDTRFMLPKPERSNVSRYSLESIATFVPLSVFILMRGILFVLPNSLPMIGVLCAVGSHLWAVCGIGVIVNITKSYVGYPRPYMLTECSPGVNLTDCKANSKRINKLFISWPSYHAATAMSSAVFLICVIQEYLRSLPLLNSLLSLLILGAAIRVGSDRIREYHHHSEDVTAGFFFGAVGSLIIWNGSKHRIFPETKQEEQTFVQIEDTVNRVLERETFSGSNSDA